MQNKFRNRLHNASNRAQGARKRVLTVCSAGLLRSPTLAWILSNAPYNYNTRSVGMVHDYALIPIDEVHVRWADVIVFAEFSHFQHFTAMFPNYKEIIPDTQLFVLDIPDDYAMRDPELVRIAEDQLAKYFVGE
jgi:predicted protein tyrosine phosphatase